MLYKYTSSAVWKLHIRTTRVYHYRTQVATCCHTPRVNDVDYLYFGLFQTLQYGKVLSMCFTCRTEIRFN